MAFWNGYRVNDFILKDLNLTTPEGLAGVCVISVAVAFIFEAVRTFRDWTYLEFLRQRSTQGTVGKESPITLTAVSPPPSSENGNGSASSGSLNNYPRISLDEQESASASGNSVSTATTTSTTTHGPPRTPVMATGTLSRSGKSSHRPGFHVGLVHLSVSALLHMCHVILGYLLMLFVMSFNIWIFLAVILGAALGYFLFDSFNRKIRALQMHVNNESSSSSHKK